MAFMGYLDIDAIYGGRFVFTALSSAVRKARGAPLFGSLHARTGRGVAREERRATYQCSVAHCFGAAS